MAFNVDNKLRTVLWGWAHEPLDEDDASGVRGLVEQLRSPGSDLVETLSRLITPRGGRHPATLRAAS